MNQKPNADAIFRNKKFGSLLQQEECATNKSDTGSHHTNCRSWYESSENNKTNKKKKSNGNRS